MSQAGYGRSLERYWGRAPLLNCTLINRGSDAHASVARIAAGPGFGFVPTVEPEDGYAISLELTDFHRGELWVDGRSTVQKRLLRDHMVFYDLRQRIEAKLDDPFDFVHFNFPQAYWNRIAADHGAVEAGELKVKCAEGMLDPVVLHLTRAIEPALQRPAEANRLFVDHIMSALCVHILGAYGRPLERSDTSGNGLAPYQLRRAKEMLSSRLDGEMTIAEIARSCNLTPSYFARQFAMSTGLLPHRWLLHQRVERAKQLLRNSDLTLSDIAHDCGFSDQSHFTRVFGRLTGATPRSWRASARN